MENRTMGEIIAALRKEKGMTQKDLADRLGITDKAVSKWERDLAYPDTANLSRLSELLGVSVEDLLQVKAAANPSPSRTEAIVDLVLRAVPLAMGVAVVVTSVLGGLDMRSGFTMLGVGMACIGIRMMKNKE